MVAAEIGGASLLCQAALGRCRGAAYNPAMRFAGTSLLGFLLLMPRAAPAQVTGPVEATYEVYAAGFHVAEVQATIDIAPRRYDMQLAYHTTGIVGFFHHGHQFNEVIGTWSGGAPHPQEFEATGTWGGNDRVTQIIYRHDDPLIERLVPPQDTEREPVPPALQQNAVDSLSALVLLMRRVQDTGRCEASVHTYDGRRASEISARTAGEQMLPQTSLSSWAGTALRCDFVGRMLAGFKYGEDTPEDRRPLHGAAWLAPIVPGAPPVPVRMEFETRWFGDAAMYLTQLHRAPPRAIAAH